MPNIGGSVRYIWESAPFIGAAEAERKAAEEAAAAEAARKAAEEAAAAEATRKADAAKATRDAVYELNSREVERQAAEAERNNRFGLARAGLSGGSADAYSNAELNRITNSGLLQAGGIADQAAANDSAAQPTEATIGNLFNSLANAYLVNQQNAAILPWLNKNQPWNFSGDLSGDLSRNLSVRSSGSQGNII